MANWYAGLDALRRRIGIMDTAEDAALRAMLEGTSRAIDAWTGRHFFVWSGSRAYTTWQRDCLQLDDDLLAVTALDTDTGADGSYGTAWATTDYVLLPAPAPTMSPPRPYWQIRAALSGANAFPSSLLGVRITGRWGYYDVRAPDVATLAEDLDAAETQVEVFGATALDVGQTLLLGTEQLFVEDLNSPILQVTRGVNGTTAAAHLLGDSLDAYTYPVISEACLLQAEHQYHLKDAPAGIIGGGSEFGPIRVSALHPTVRLMLSGFRRHGIV